MYQSVLRSVLVLCFVFLFAGTSLACVGRTLYIGMLDNDQEQVLVEAVAQIINERTGTAVKTRIFATRDLLYQALQAEEEDKRVDIIIENTENAATILSMARNSDQAQEYLQVKKLYKEKFETIWLTPFRFSKNNPEINAFHACLVRQDVLVNFPLLPRVINKLADAVNVEEHVRLLGELQSGSAKHKNIARDFLKNKKLI